MFLIKDFFFTRQFLLCALISPYCLLAFALSEQGSSTLPPPAYPIASTEKISYQLELVINEYATGLIVPVIAYQSHYWVRAIDLQRAGLPLDQLTQPKTDVSILDKVKVHYDSAGQRLFLQIPERWLPEQSILSGQFLPHFQPHSSQGILFNYDIYANRDENHSTRIAIWNEIRLFSKHGILSNTGTLKRIFNQYSTDPSYYQDQGFRRYDTTFTNVDENRMLSWSVGDMISPALNWNSSVRMGGISIGHDFSTRPDIVTYPLPTFSGQTAVPTTLDLFINGYRFSRSNLRPGPFTLINTPYINGAGDAVLTTTDSLGRQVSTTMPFYVANVLLKTGLSAASWSIGALRRDYGIKDFSYGALATSGSYRYGVNDYWTFETHGEGAKYLGMAGVGSLLKLARWGVLNSAYTTSRTRGDKGYQIDWGYQYNNSRISLAAQYTRRDKLFRNLALYDGVHTTLLDSALIHTSTQYSAALSLNQYGNIGLAYIGIEDFSGDKTRLFNASWSKSLWKNSSLYLSANRNFSQGSWLLAMSLQIPFGLSDSLTLSADHNAFGQNQQRIDYFHSMASNGGFSWNLAYANDSSQNNYRQASVGWRNDKLESQLGTYGRPGYYTQWAEAAGSLVMIDHTLLVANKVNDAFVVVSTNGYPEVSVNYENQPMGKTDQHGYLLISRVPSYYPGHYSIDTLNLPADISIEKTDQRLAVRKNSGYVAHFLIKKQHAANVILVDQNGEALPVSSLVTYADNQKTTIGWEGMAYLKGLSQQNTLLVRTLDGRQCHTTFTLAATFLDELKTYGPLTCSLTTLDPSK